MSEEEEQRDGAQAPSATKPTKPLHYAGAGTGFSSRSDSEFDSADSDEESGGGMGFLDHLEELRRRLIKMILAVLVGASCALVFGEEIFQFVIRPLGDLPLHVTTVTGSFYAYLTVSLFAGVIAVIPYLFYQFWGFVAPGLYRRESKTILPAIFASTMLFLLGSGFCFEIVLPLAIEYLIGFGENTLVPIITVGSYISFAGMMIVAFGLGFNFPVVAYFLAKLGLITARTLSKGRRIGFVVILIFGAILTPPDIFTQMLLAGPLYLLYEVSIIVVRLTNRDDEDKKD